MPDALDQSPLFAGLNEAALADLRGIARPFAVARGETLFRQGDPPTGLYVLDCGSLEIATRMPGDEDARVSRIAPGEVVGEFALLDPGPRSARVAAAEAATGLFLPARSFIAMLEEGRAGAVEAIDRLRTLVAQRTRATLERLAQNPHVEASELRARPSVVAAARASLEPETLGNLPRFADLGDGDLAAMLVEATPETLERGTGVGAGEARGDVWLVVRGAIRSAFERAAGHEQVMVHGPGEWAGLVAAIDGGAQPLALSAAEQAVLLRVPGGRFARWRTESARAAQAIMAGVDRQLVRDQRRANRHLGRAIALERFNARVRAA